jgi:hypothetical protein
MREDMAPKRPASTQFAECADHHALPMDKAWNLDGYRFGAAAFALLTVLVLALLVGRLRSDGPAIRWFAAGLSASMVGGITQALTVFTLGATLPGAASYAVLLGHLVESACWMMALASRFRADRLGMQRQLECEANHDPLTGSLSRTALKQQIGQALASVKRRPEKVFRGTLSGPGRVQASQRQPGTCAQRSGAGRRGGSLGGIEPAQ